MNARNVFTNDVAFIVHTFFTEEEELDDFVENWKLVTGASGNWTAASGCVVWASGLVMTPLEWTAASRVPFIKLPKILTPTYEMSYRRHPLAGDLIYA